MKTRSSRRNALLTCASILAICASGAASGQSATINNEDVIVDGSGDGTSGDRNSPFNVGGDFIVGSSGTASLTIRNGGVVNSGFSEIGFLEGSTGTVLVTGTGSLWTINGSLLIVGVSGAGTLTISDGGEVRSSGSSRISDGNMSTGSVTVTGAGSRWTAGQQLSVATGGSGALTIENGGFVGAGTVFIGASSFGTGNVIVRGADSILEVGNFIRVGENGTAVLTIANGGMVSAPLVRIADGFGGGIATSFGTLNIGAAAGDDAVAAGILNTPIIEFGAGTGTIVFNHTSNDFELDADISGNGTIRLLSGRTLLSGNSTYTGSTIFDGGTLALGSDNALGSSTLTVTGAFQQGNPTLVANGGPRVLDNNIVFDRPGGMPFAAYLTINAPTHALTLNGDLSGSGVIRIAGQAGVTFTGAVSSFLELSNALVRFESGLFHSIDGTNSTLELGDGVSGFSFIDVDGLTLRTRPGESAELSGAISFAFGGLTLSGGTLAVNSNISGANDEVNVTGGAITLGGNNSFAGGLTVSGGSLTLAHANALPSGNILTLTNNGSVTANHALSLAGLNMSAASSLALNATATINSANTHTLAGIISGGGGLVFNGGGRFILSGANTYTGSTLLEGGTLTLGSNTALGGSTLRTLGSVVDYPDGVTIANGIIIDSDTTQFRVLSGSATQSGVISEDNGPRPFEKIGDGELILTATNTWTGETTVSAGTLTFDGGSVALGAGQDFYVGRNNGDEAALNIVNGGEISNAIGYIGFEAGSTGAALVSGAGSTWTNSGRFEVGRGGSGTLILSDGGTVSSTLGVVGNFAGSDGNVTITGAGSSWTSTGLIVGEFGSGILTIEEGGLVTNNGGGSIGVRAGSRGDVTVTGAGSAWNTLNDLLVGFEGIGTLTISHGAQVTNGMARLGYQAGSDGTVLVTGVGSSWTSSSSLDVGEGGSATLTIEDGGSVSNTFGFIGFEAGSTGDVTVTGEGSSWGNSSQLLVGNNGSATLTIEDGGSVSNTDGFVGAAAGSKGDVTVTGSGSTWGNSGELQVGRNGTGTLTIENGGSVSNTDGFVGIFAASKGDVLVTGAGSTWSNSAGLVVGFESSGTLTISDDGVVSATSLTLGEFASSTGTLNIGAGEGDAAVAAGMLDTGTLEFGEGVGRLVFNHTAATGSSGYVFGADISSDAAGDALIRNLAGFTRLTGDSAGYQGGLSVEGGRLSVDGVLGSGAVLANVLSGGVLTGTGTLGGDVTVQSGGILAGQSGFTFTIGGDLTLLSGASVNVALGGPGGSELFAVGGDLTLDGTLNVTDAGGFGPGLYNLFTYGGGLTDNGFTLDNVAGGPFLPGEVQIQTGIAGQVNLLSSTGVDLLFWDGDAPGNAANGAIDGGDGVWTALSDTFTDASGTVNGPARPSPAFVIFSAEAGTVTVDDSEGDIEIAGAQFAVDGYTIEGDGITLIGNGSNEAIFRVGDGTADGGGFTATIGSDLSGNARLVRTDLGTLILTGANTYAGGTEVRGGTLVVDGGSISHASGTTFVGVNNGDAATLNIINGGSVSNTIGFIGAAAGSTGAALVSGAGSTWANSSFLDVGRFGSGTLTIEGGASVSNTTGLIGRNAGSTGFARVSGAGSTWGNSSELYVGFEGTGTLTIQDGGAVSNTTGFVGSLAGSKGDVTVTGAGSSWTNSGRLMIAERGGAGALTISDGGVVSATSLMLSRFAPSTGTLNIGAAADEDAEAAGTLDSDTLEFGEGVGRLVFNHTSGGAGYVFGADISSHAGGDALIRQLAGFTRLTGDSSGYQGDLEIGGGTLSVDGVMGSGDVSATVASGATLTGSGTLDGDVTIGAGAILAGQSGLTFTIGGDLELQDGAEVNVALGAPGGSELFAVGGDLTLDGTLNVTDAGGFGPGLYNLFTYGGGLTDNGLEIGTAPFAGLLPGELTVQTNIAGQVNLISSIGADLLFWDGDAPGNATNGLIDGGDGVWTANSFNFTDIGGLVSGPSRPTPGFIIFAGAAGNVTVDDSEGDIEIAGAQFAVDGYSIEGDGITLIGNGDGEAIIRVGDGTQAGAGFSATIGSDLSGDAALVLSDFGTLILTGTNSYTGGTQVRAGTLIGSTASIIGDIANDGVVVFDQAGDATLNQTLSGDGLFRFAGGAEYTLGSGNTYSGGTQIDGSGLVLTADDSAGMGAIALSDASLSYAAGVTISNRLEVSGANSLSASAGVATHAGSLSGSGDFTLGAAGAGTLVFAGNGSAFAGNTTIAGNVLINGILGGNIEVADGGVLRGFGVLGSTRLLSGSTISPGNSVGTLTINGDLIFESGSLYEATALPNGQSDLINVTGTTTINGGSVLVVGNDSGFAPLTTYTILSSAGGITGMFDSVSSDFAFLDPRLSVMGSSLTLTLERNDVDFVQFARSPNQRSAAGAVDTLGGGNPLWNAVALLDAGSAPLAFEALSGEIHATQRQTVLDDTIHSRRAVTSRLNAARGDDAGAAWVSGHFGGAQMGARQGVSRTSSDSSGVMLGLDAPVGETARIGVIAAFGETGFSQTGSLNGAGLAESRSLGVYGGAQLGQLGVSAGAIYGWHDLTTNRLVRFPGVDEQIRSSHSADTVQLFGEASMTGPAGFEPFVSLAHVRLETGGFSEVGGVSALTIDSETRQMTQGTLGSRYSHDWRIGETHLKFEGSLGWRRVFSGERQFVSGTLSGAPVYFEGNGVDRDAAAIEAGIVIEPAGGLSLEIGYAGEVGSKARNHGMEFRARWAF